MKWPLKVLHFLPSITSSGTLNFTTGQNLRAESPSFPSWSWGMVEVEAQRKEKGIKQPISAAIFSRKAGLRFKKEILSASKPLDSPPGLDHHTPILRNLGASLSQDAWGNHSHLLCLAHLLPDEIQSWGAQQARGELKERRKDQCGTWLVMDPSRLCSNVLFHQRRNQNHSSQAVLFTNEWKANTTEFYSSHFSSLQLCYCNACALDGLDSNGTQETQTDD